jgi:hypothetical protein
MVPSSCAAHIVKSKAPNKGPRKRDQRIASAFFITASLASQTWQKASLERVDQRRSASSTVAAHSPKVLADDLRPEQNPDDVVRTLSDVVHGEVDVRQSRHDALRRNRPAMDAGAGGRMRCSARRREQGSPIAIGVARLVDEVRGSTVATVAKRHGVRRGLWHGGSGGSRATPSDGALCARDSCA